MSLLNTNFVWYLVSIISGDMIVAANDPLITATLGSPLFVWSLKTILLVVCQESRSAVHLKLARAHSLVRSSIVTYGYELSTHTKTPTHDAVIECNHITLKKSSCIQSQHL